MELHHFQRWFNYKMVVTALANETKVSRENHRPRKQKYRKKIIDFSEVTDKLEHTSLR